MSEDKARFIIAIRNYNFQKSEVFTEFTDITASSPSNEKILLRSINPESKIRFAGINEVKNMEKALKHGNYDTGVLISERFTIAAVEEMGKGNIQQVSDAYMPPLDTEALYITITNCINEQCRLKCGEILVKETDCKEQPKGTFCKIKALRDNSSFHFEHGWRDLLKKDLERLLSLSILPQ